MSDNLQNRAGSDRNRINVNQDYELRYWSQKFGVSADELREAVNEVGPMAEAVEQRLRGRNAKSRGG